MIKKEKQCIICETNQAICTLKEIIEAESAEQVKFQAKALLELHFELDDDHFCEECFWK